jgi:hypothetical protein
MKLKSLLLAGVVGVAGAAAASAADTVYSVNQVGYVNVEVAAGSPSTPTFKLISNPVSQPTNSLNAILPNAPVQTKIFKYNGTSFSTFTKFGGGWSPNGSTTIINPGEGFFVQNTNASTLTLTFIGEVPSGTLNISLPTGFSLVASAVPQSGAIQTDLEFPNPGANTDKIWRFTGTSYTSYRKFTNWSPSEPVINVAEGFWFENTSGAKVWTRVYNVNE